MSTVRFSDALFEQIGGVHWQLTSRVHVSAALCGEESVSGKKPNHDSLKSVSLLSDEQENRHEVAEDSQVCSAEETYIVVLGAGLDEVWHNDTHQAWQLWQNIMQAFGWEESQIVFFDTLHLVQEEMIFSTLEEIIELGVEWVLCMDEQHSIVESLQEGIHIVGVPDLASMLVDPYAKKTFYCALSAQPGIVL